MLNMLKMDLYRMFCTRSMYVIWIVMAVVIVATTALVKMDFDAINAENPAQEEQLTEAGTEDVNVGINVELPTQRGESITVFDVFYGECPYLYAHNRAFVPVYRSVQRIRGTFPLIGQLQAPDDGVHDIQLH